jgi:hypothetical protein
MEPSVIPAGRACPPDRCCDRVVLEGRWSCDWLVSEGGWFGYIREGFFFRRESMEPSMLPGEGLSALPRRARGFRKVAGYFFRVVYSGVRRVILGVIETHLLPGRDGRRRYGDTAIRRYDDTQLQRDYGTMVLRHTLLCYYAITLVWYYGTMVTHYYTTTPLRYYATTLKRRRRMAQRLERLHLHVRLAPRLEREQRVGARAPERRGRESFVREKTKCLRWPKQYFFCDSEYGDVNTEV